MILRGCGCWWNCRNPIGMQLASGLSLALSTSKRCFLIARDHSVYGRPPAILPPASKNVATGGPFGSYGIGAVGGSSCTPPRPPANAAFVSPPRPAPPSGGAAGGAPAGGGPPAGPPPCP